MRLLRRSGVPNMAARWRQEWMTIFLYEKLPLQDVLEKLTVTHKIEYWQFKTVQILHSFVCF